MGGGGGLFQCEYDILSHIPGDRSKFQLTNNMGSSETHASQSLMCWECGLFVFLITFCLTEKKEFLGFH